MNETLSGKRILAVEDEYMLAQELALFLQPAAAQGPMQRDQVDRGKRGGEGCRPADDRDDRKGYREPAKDRQEGRQGVLQRWNKAVSPARISVCG